MTKDKKLGRMSTTSAEKRRSFIPGGGSSNTSSNTGGGGSSKDNNTSGGSHTAPSNAGSSSNKTSSQGGSNTNVLHTSNPRSSSSAANIIAPPPRAHHAPASSSASPNHEDAAATAAASSGSKDAKDKESRQKETGAGNTSGGGSSGNSAKDKDARIAHLERELEIMEREFTRELDKLSQNESETAVFWQAKHSDLNQQFLRADADLRLLRQEAEARDADRDALRREAAELRAQVRGLKEFVSTSTRTSGQTSDEVFCDGMARLSNGLQNWVIVNFRKAKLDTSAASEDVREELGRLVPMYADLEPSAKVHTLQSVVSRVLVDAIFDSYFFGLPREQAEQLKAAEQTLTSFVDSPEAINNWRSATLTLLHREAEAKMQAETSAATDRVIARVNRVLGAIVAADSPPATEARDAALRALVASAADLARQLAVQKAVFRVFVPDIVPHHRTRFDPATMEDIGGEDEDELARRDIACVTFPGVIKRGDESGGHMQYENVIAKARVLCSPQ
ncbi:hypothetical protein LZ30DRAFT_778121 [Colletotrichum cereale]|nr:hypothetical protein LZ30DRAFT_778121 [Colletotrichum cereale]